MKTRLIILLLSLSVITLGCKKFLDKKPDQKDVVPSSLPDLQALLDDYQNIVQDPAAAEISADDYYMTFPNWSTLLNEGDRRIHTWQKGYQFSPAPNDWLIIYRSVYRANVILDFLPKITQIPSNQIEWNNIKGQALFLRARNLFSASMIWANAYDSVNSPNDLGVPIRSNSDFNVPSNRPTNVETYKQIVDDLLEASTLLPNIPVHVLRSSKPAALGMLARAYLFMRDYKNCLQYSNAALEINGKLMNYNNVSANKVFPFEQYNIEVLYDAYLPTPQPINMTRGKINLELYASYENGDLRKSLFFRDNGNGSFAFRGSYEGNAAQFSGVAVDELYLMRAECYARNGNVANAMADLNTLLATRFKSGLFKPVTASSPDLALKIILLERRKELLMRGLRWAELKRLNKEGANIVLTRQLNDTVYSLLPNDNRYTLSIPEDVVQLSGITQNP